MLDEQDVISQGTFNRDSMDHLSCQDHYLTDTRTAGGNSAIPVSHL